MKQIQVVKIGSLKEKDETRRGKVKVVDVPMDPVGPNEVKIKVAYCAVCGSDPHLVEGIFGWEPPFGIGHELSGVIVELGEKATKKGLKMGDRVAGNFLHFCGTCYYCQNGQQQFCEYGEDSNKPGMSEYVVWNEAQVYKLPDNVSLAEGCLLEPVSIIIRIMDKVSPRFGGRILVSGGGPIGLLAVQALKKFGAANLTLSEPIKDRRDLALNKYKVDHVIDPLNEDFMQRSMEITDNRGFDVVIDCSGSVHAVTALPQITAKGGTLLYGAMYPNDYEMPLNIYKYCYMNELTISGFFVAPYAYPRASQSLSMFDLSDFTKKVFYIDDAEAAFEAQVSGEFMKILINCNEDLKNL